VFFIERIGHDNTLPSQAEAKAIALAADVALLAEWLRRDQIVSLTGPEHATRCGLYDFVVAELRLGEPLCPHRIGPVVRALTNLPIAGTAPESAVVTRKQREMNQAP
jgi:hypothetical protein